MPAIMEEKMTKSRMKSFKRNIVVFRLNNDDCRSTAAWPLALQEGNRSAG